MCAIIGCLIFIKGVTGVSIDEDDYEGINSSLVISAVNAGYTYEGVQQNYDFIELYNNTGEILALDGYRIEYVNSVGNVAGSISFPVGTDLNSEYLLLGFAKSPQYAEVGKEYLYNFGSSAGLASTAGVVRLYKDGALVDEICWGSAVCSESYVKFATTQEANMTLQRCIVDGVIERCGDEAWFRYVKYYPEIKEGVLKSRSMEVPELLPQCFGLVISEIYSYFENDYAEQFVEIYNPTDEIIELEGCGLKFKNKIYELVGELAPDEYLAYQNLDLKLTKNPTNSNELFLLDVDGSIVSKAEYYYGQKKGTSWALFNLGEDEEKWLQTYSVTKGSENVYQEFRNCPSGKVINPQTGNCINFNEDEELPACPVGKFRNPETNRCKSYESIDNILKPCDDGYFRNPETNRCKKVATATGELKPCADGYERNLETNRCRKVRENNGADFGVIDGDKSGGLGWVGYGALAIIVAIGVGYLLWQFRDEVKRGMMRIMKAKERRR
jgi:hypothetical protein